MRVSKCAQSPVHLIKATPELVVRAIDRSSARLRRQAQLAAKFTLDNHA